MSRMADQPEARPRSRSAQPDTRSGGARRSPRMQRQRQIVDHVVDQGSASAAELVELTGVSLMTVHRDLDELAGRGVLRRFHGGVSAQPSSVFEASSDFRLHVNTGAKDALARRALELLEPGMSVMLDDSSTTLALARLLPEVGPMTVATNYRCTLDALAEVPDIRLIAIGGEYSRTHDSYLGLPCQEAIERLSVDISFQSTSAMDARMTYHQEQEIVPVKRSMLHAAARGVLLMDSSKVGRTALHRLVPLNAFSASVITDDVEPSQLEVMAEQTELYLASLAGESEATTDAPKDR